MSEERKVRSGLDHICFVFILILGWEERRRVAVERLRGEEFGMDSSVGVGLGPGILILRWWWLWCLHCTNTKVRYLS